MIWFDGWRINRRCPGCCCAHDSIHRFFQQILIHNVILTYSTEQKHCPCINFNFHYLFIIKSQQWSRRKVAEQPLKVAHTQDKTWLQLRIQQQHFVFLMLHSMWLIFTNLPIIIEGRAAAASVLHQVENILCNIQTSFILKRALIWKERTASQRKWNEELIFWVYPQGEVFWWSHF